MRIVTFYSYKGGTGRTLLVANTALFLASAGKRVAIIDFDFEAPGLPYKFSLKTKQSQWNLGPGIIGHLAAFLDGRLERIDVKAISRTLTAPSGSSGSAVLIPAGAAPSNEYAAELSRIDWHSFYWGNQNTKDREAVSRSRRWYEVFNELRQQIEAEIGPDYLLVDSRTGLADISGISLNFLPDVVVALMLYNDENLEGVRQALRGAKVAAAGHRDVRIIPIVTRIPRALAATKQDNDLIEEILNYMVEPSERLASSLSRRDLKEVLCLHSEPSLEALERLLSQSEDVTLRESALLRDYLAFFNCLDAGAFKESPLAESLQLLQQGNVHQWLGPGQQAMQTDTTLRYRPLGSVQQMAARVGSRRSLRVVEPYFLPDAKGYREFCTLIAQRLQRELQLPDIEYVRESSINYNLLGFQMREGRFDLCTEAYFLTPLRSELADLLQFGELNSFLLIASGSKEFSDNASDLAIAKEGVLEDVLKKWTEYAIRENKVVRIGILGETAATSASESTLSDVLKSDQIENVVTHEELAEYLKTPHSSEIRLGLIDHGVFRRMVGTSEVESSWTTQTLRFHQTLPVGFLLPPGDDIWRRDVANVVSCTLQELGNARWENIKQELATQAQIEVFDFESFWKYLSLDMTLSKASRWLKEFRR